MVFSFSIEPDEMTMKYAKSHRKNIYIYIKKK